MHNFIEREYYNTFCSLEAGWECLGSIKPLLKYPKGDTSDEEQCLGARIPRILRFLPKKKRILKWKMKKSRNFFGKQGDNSSV